MKVMILAGGEQLFAFPPAPFPRKGVTILESALCAD
jgi:hypothetical protein